MKANPLINFIVFIILVPIIYICILIFDAVLISRTRTTQQRWRSLAGVLGGFLTGVIIIMLDQSFGPLIMPQQPQNAFEISWSSAVIAGIIGFLVLLGIDFLISRGVIPFVVLFTVLSVLLSAYFLLQLNDTLRTATAISTMGFLVGVILYFMVFPTRIFNALRGGNQEIDTEKDE